MSPPSFTLYDQNSAGIDCAHAALFSGKMTIFSEKNRVWVFKFLNFPNLLTLLDDASEMHPKLQGGLLMPTPIKTHLVAFLTHFFHITWFGGQNNLWKFFKIRFLAQKYHFGLLSAQPSSVIHHWNHQLKHYWFPLRKSVWVETIFIWRFFERFIKIWLFWLF